MTVESAPGFTNCPSVHIYLQLIKAFKSYSECHNWISHPLNCEDNGMGKKHNSLIHHQQNLESLIYQAVYKIYVEMNSWLDRFIVVLWYIIF